MDTSQTPRINGAMVNQFLGRTVTLICQDAMGSADGAHYQATAPDGISVNLILPPGESFVSKYTQVIGKVVGPGAVEVHRVTPAGNDFDMDNYNKAVELMNGRFSTLF